MVTPRLPDSVPNDRLLTPPLSASENTPATGHGLGQLRKLAYVSRTRFAVREGTRVPT